MAEGCMRLAGEKVCPILNSSATCCAISAPLGSNPLNAMLYPWAANALAMPRPIPLVLPVINMFFDKSKDLCKLSKDSAFEILLLLVAQLYHPPYLVVLTCQLPV